MTASLTSHSARHTQKVLQSHANGIKPTTSAEVAALHAVTRSLPIRSASLPPMGAAAMPRAVINEKSLPRSPAVKPHLVATSGMTVNHADKPVFRLTRIASSAH
eukprot:4364141-Prymnesium_polylepis.2